MGPSNDVEGRPKGPPKLSKRFQVPAKRCPMASKFFTGPPETAHGNAWKPLYSACQALGRPWTGSHAAPVRRLLRHSALHAVGTSGVFMSPFDAALVCRCGCALIRRRAGALPPHPRESAGFEARPSSAFGQCPVRPFARDANAHAAGVRVCVLGAKLPGAAQTALERRGRSALGGGGGGNRGAFRASLDVAGRSWEALVISLEARGRVAMGFRGVCKAPPGPSNDVEGRPTAPPKLSKGLQGLPSDVRWFPSASMGLPKHSKGFHGPPSVF